MGTFETAVTVLSKTKTRSVLKFLNVKVADSGVFQCGRDIASLFIESPVDSVATTAQKREEGVVISCFSTGAPIPDIFVSVFFDEYENKKLISLREWIIKKTRFSIMKEFLLDTSQTYIKIRYQCKATQKFSNGTLLKASSSGWHIMPYPEPKSQPRKCNFTIKSDDGQILVWTGGYTDHRYLSGAKQINVQCDPETNQDRHNDVIIIPNETNLLIGSKISMQCNVMVYPNPRYLYLSKDNVVINKVNLNWTDVRPLFDYNVESASIDDDGYYSCLLSDRDISDTVGTKSSATIKVTVFQKVVIEINSTDILHPVGALQYEVQNGTHVHLRCKAYGFPAPYNVFLALNLQPVEGETFSNLTFVEVKAFIPVHQTSDISCYASQNKFGERVNLKSHIVLTPVNKKLHYFLSNFSSWDILVITGCISFSVLLMLSSCVLICAKATNKHLLHKLSSFELSEIKYALNELIEQPFVESYNFFRNSLLCSSEATHDAVYLYQCEDLATTDSNTCGIKNGYDDVASEYDDTTNEAICAEPANRIATVNVHRNNENSGNDQSNNSNARKRQGIVVLSNNRFSNKTNPSNLSYLTNLSNMSSLTYQSNLSTEDSDQINKIRV